MRRPSTGFHTKTAARMFLALLAALALVQIPRADGLDSENLPPSAVISFPRDQSRFNPGVAIPFNGSESSDPDGNISSSSWDFGDGSLNIAGLAADHAYKLDGEYLATLTVVDGMGLSCSTKVKVVITSLKGAPTAHIRNPKDKSLHRPNEIINFSSLGSFDPGGHPLEYDWDFGDGNGSTLAYPNHSYEREGTYTARLDVWVTGGTSKCGFLITVHISSGNLPPVAVVSSPPEYAYYWPNETIHFSANGSYDPDGGNISVAWYEGWSWHDPYREKKTPVSNEMDYYWSSREEIIYSMVLVVTDEKGLQSTIEAHTFVYNYWLPSPCIASPLNGSSFIVGQEITFTGFCNRYDSHHPELNYSWAFGDGSRANGQNATHAYSKAGKYQATLSINDGEKTGTRHAVFTVLGSAPEPDVSFSPGGDTNETLRFPVNQPVHFSAQEWADQGGPSTLCFWDFGDGGNGTGPNATHTFRRAGDFLVELRVVAGTNVTTDRRIVTIYSVPVQGGLQLPGIPLAAVLVAAPLIAATAFFAGTELGLFMFYSFLVFLYSKIRREEVLDNYVRGQIHGYIVANPGDHYNSILKALKLNNGTLAWHIRKLEDEGIVKGRTDGIHKRFYPSETQVPEPDGGALTEVQRMIMAKVRETPGVSQKDIAALLKVSGSTVNYHIGTLVGQGKVRQERDGMKVRYFATEISPHDGEKELRNDAAGPSRSLSSAPAGTSRAPRRRPSRIRCARGSRSRGSM